MDSRPVPYLPAFPLVCAVRSASFHFHSLSTPVPEVAKPYGCVFLRSLSFVLVAFLATSPPRSPLASSVHSSPFIAKYLRVIRSCFAHYTICL